MARKLYLILSGGIFLLVAVFHLLRLVYHWPIVVGPTTIPFALSYAGFLHRRRIAPGRYGCWLAIRGRGD